MGRATWTSASRLVEGGDEGGGDVGEAAGLGGHALGEVAHVLGKVGDLWGDDEDARDFAAAAAFEAALGDVFAG